jgi:hypothetical protein
MRVLRSVALPIALACLPMAILSGQPKRDIAAWPGVLTVDRIDRDTIRFLNADGTLWYQFSFFYDESDGKFDFPNDHFRPWAFKVDNFVLVLAVTQRDSTGYKVVVNHETGLQKWIRPQPYLTFESWSEHLLRLCCVDFDPRSNPIRRAPNDSAATIAYPGRGPLYVPIEVRGDWVLIGWGKLNHDELRKGPTGWIRWKRGSRLLVDMFHDA